MTPSIARGGRRVTPDPTRGDDLNRAELTAEEKAALRSVLYGQRARPVPDDGLS